jgi:hypothetical protein
VADTSGCVTPRGCQLTTSQPPVTRCPRNSAHLPLALRRLAVRERTQEPGCPRATPGHTADRSGIPARASPGDTACSEVPEAYSVLPDSASITAPFLLHKHTRSKGPSLHWRYPASSAVRPAPTSARAGALTAALELRSPRQRISPHYPDHLLDLPCSLPRRIGTGAGRFLPCPCGLPLSQRGRQPPLHFRGLLELHSRYGLPSCSPA